MAQKSDRLRWVRGAVGGGGGGGGGGAGGGGERENSNPKI